MKCIRKKCRGKLRVVRTATGRGMAVQDRQCDLCGARKNYIVRPLEGEEGDVRSVLKRLEEER